MEAVGVGVVEERAAAVVAGMAAGARLGGRLSPVTMRRAFGWFVLAVAIFVLVNKPGY
jgi:uncharacterized membrane protein YfcA